jgi:hypothetical protein
VKIAKASLGGRLALLLVVCLGCGRSEPRQPAVSKPPEPATTGAALDTLREPSVDDATVLIHTYYVAINAKRYRDAYVCWAGLGEASRQTYERFEAGFAQTDSVAVDVGEPFDIGAAAGSRYVRIPVRIVAHSGGATETFAGTYTLRRSVVDGATREQRLWRIGGADIRRSP